MTARLTLERPWLALDFARPLQVLSWALNAPGFVRADGVLWREVSNADLPRDHDVAAWLARELAQRGATGTPCFLTSRNITRFVETRAEVDGVTVRTVATLGLSNAERVGARMAYDPARWGTINIAVETDLGLTQTALIEGMSIVAQARTAALVDHGPMIATGRVTGTGTDCIALAAPPGDTGYCGLHTPQGEAIGRAVYDAVAQATRSWMEENSLVS